MAKTKAKLFSMKNLCLALLFFQTHLLLCNGIDVLGPKSLFLNELDAMVVRPCSGKIGECLSATETEMEMNSEINRRVLVMQKRYISYETLKKDMTPCTRPGASYYNCHAMGQANPYTRGCEVITGCRRGIKDDKP